MSCLRDEHLMQSNGKVCPQPLMLPATAAIPQVCMQLQQRQRVSSIGGQYSPRCDGTQRGHAVY